MFTVILAGHLGRDPETRFTPNGKKVTSFTVATNQRKGKEDVTIWVRVTVWDESLDKMIAYLKKGSSVIVTGRMSPPSIYADREGNTQVTLEVVAEMIDFSPFGKGDRAAEGNSTQSHQSSSQGYEGGSAQEEASPSYARHGTSMTGQNSRQAESEEDSLPF